jgi:hypothetical protein
MKKLILFTLLVMTLASFGVVALADGPVTCPPGSKCLPNPLNSTNTVFDLVKKVVTWLVDFLAPLIATVMVIVGAFQMILAKGDPKAFDTGRKTVLYTVIGYAILLLGSNLTAIVSDFLNTN